MTAWFDQLVEPWQHALENAWASFRDGNSPIGAIVVDADGKVVGFGAEPPIGCS